MNLRYVLLALALLAGAGAVSAEVEVPQLRARVTDLTSTLSAEQIGTLEQRLAEFETRKGSQVAVLIVPTIQPEAIEQYSIRVVDQWKLGRENVDDGVLLLVAKDDRKLRIEVGHGLEGALPDVIAKRIIEEIIVPRFRADDFYGGISDGVGRVIGVIEGEPLPEPEDSGSRPSTNLDSFVPALFVAMLVGSFITQLLGRLAGSGVTALSTGAIMWMITSSLLWSGLGALFFVILVVGMQSARRAGWVSSGGGHSSGGSSGWSSGGGGFSGGGGSFGGGGASGGW